MIDSKIIVALDFSTKQQALELISKIDPTLCRLKVGKEMFTHYGPKFIEEIHKKEFEVFLDLKYHDIPNTVARTCEVAADLGVWMLNVHALGGRRMMEAALEALAKRSTRPLLIAVTVLTSMSADDLAEVGVNLPPADFALQLARLAKDSGLDGIVCSAQEAATMKQSLGRGFLLVTPGIRPAGSIADDQRRIMTPLEAVSAGSDYLVIGRPVTQNDDPISILRTINSEISPL